MSRKKNKARRPVAGLQAHDGVLVGQSFNYEGAQHRVVEFVRRPNAVYARCEVEGRVSTRLVRPAKLVAANAGW